MARFPTISAEERTPTTDFIEQGIRRQTFSKSAFIAGWEDASGTILGPYAALPHDSPSLSPSLDKRELAVLAVMTEYDAPYVLYAHSEIALAAGLSREQIQQAVDGMVPDGLDEQEAMVYSLVLKLATLRRRRSTQERKHFYCA
ncbi:hypothetical protein F9C07_13368 [Aspergillus flavus]|uniref:Carboxymuconolactone decarboxylase-like domain-containing protein n=1 Tax=Aspergillus flavus (strain ATCC 200026 / FGSC A1120 / IAM 13836 / NRRL 3357 / JCM 12722 / SRRC 167) TaxID=332952 RepID=A0A7U2MYC1_ASPFN|nr:hypothetical protein F9C07_13368 [Aspergillus flavus]